MDDAGAVFISSCEYCFYQTGVDIRTRVSTSWPCKRQRKRETFVRFQHFYLILSSDSAVSQRAFFLPIPALGLDLLVNQNYMTYLLYRHVNEMCVPQTCREVALCPGLLMKSYFLYFFLGRPGRLCDLWQWVRIVGKKTKTQKTLALPEDRCWLWVRRTKTVILPITTSVLLHKKYFRSLKIWLKPANLKDFVIVAL